MDGEEMNSGHYWMHSNCIFCNIIGWVVPTWNRQMCHSIDLQSCQDEDTIIRVEVPSDCHRRKLWVTLVGGSSCHPGGSFLSFPDPKNPGQSGIWLLWEAFVTLWLFLVKRIWIKVASDYRGRRHGVILEGLVGAFDPNSQTDQRGIWLSWEET